MEEQTGNMFLAVFLAVLLAGAILLYLIPMVQEERAEQQKEDDEWSKAVQQLGRGRNAELKKYDDIKSRIKDIEIHTDQFNDDRGWLRVEVTFLDIDGENIDFDFRYHQLCYEVEIYNSAQERIASESDCIAESGYGTYVDVDNLPEDSTLKVSCRSAWDPESCRDYANIEKEIRIKDNSIVTPLIPTPTPTPTVPGFEVVFAIGSLLAVAYLVVRRRR